MPEKTLVDKLIPRQRISLAPFDEWDYDTVVRYAKDAKQKHYDRSKAYAVDKDHFQDGKEWVGPGDPAVNLDIERQFAPEDAVGEVLDNVSNAFSEPQINIIDHEEKVNDASTKLLQQWWQKRKLSEKILEIQRTSAWAGAATLRLWIPSRFMETDGQNTFFVKTNSVEDALSCIFVTAPLPEDSMLLIDANTQERVGIHFDEEVIYNDKDNYETFRRAEMVYLDPNRVKDEESTTIFRVVYANEEKQNLRAELPLGGNLTIAEMRTSILTTDPVIRTQRQLNFISTIVTRLTETAGFRERYLLNAKPIGDRAPYNEGTSIPEGSFVERDEEEKEWLVTPTQRTLGANTTTELVGMPEMGVNDEFKATGSPAVIVIEPVDPSPYLAVVDAIRRRILRMCGQGHLGGISNAESSGIAYEQARAVFEKDLNKRRIAEEGMLREFLATVLHFAEQIAGKVGELTDGTRVIVEQRVNPGPRSPDLVRLDIESVEAGIMSRETVMARIGIDDTEAELVRIRTSALYILSLLEQAAKLGDQFTPESIKQMLLAFDVPEDAIGVLVEKEDPLLPNVGGEPPTSQGD